MLKKLKHMGGLRAVCGLSLLVCCATALAQSPADIDAARRQAEILQRQQDELIKRDRDAAQPAQKAPGGTDTRSLIPPVDASRAAGKCRDISNIAISGAPRLSDSVRQQINRDYSGRCLGVPEIEQILGEITRDYVLRGYVTTRAYLPSQDLSRGRLDILVVEGKVEKIRVEDGGRHSLSPRNTVPARAGEVLDLRDLEQGIDQINRLQSNRATLDIQPGSEAGLSEVVIRNEPGRRFHAQLSYDNQGAESTGQNQAGATLMSDDLLGWSEFMSVTHREAIPGDKDGAYSASDSASFVVPYGYNTFSYNGSESRYMSAVHAPSGIDLHTGGTSTSNALRWDRVVFRNQATRASLAGTFTNKDSKSYLEGQLLSVSSRKLSVLDLDGNVTTSLGSGLLSLDLGWAQGLTTAGALRDMDHLPDEAPRAQFAKIKYGAGYTLPFRWLSRDWTFSSQLTGQQAHTTLYGSEQISIGGIYSVRGFVDNTLAGDHGYYVRNELSLRQLVTLAGVALPVRWFVALDGGEVSNRAPGVPQGGLVGAALGASIYWGGASLDVFASCPVAMPRFMERESCQTWFRLSYAI